MFLGKVIGEVWSTQKSRDLEGKRLLVVERLKMDPHEAEVTPVIAADPLGANLDEVVVVAFGKAARVAVDGGHVPSKDWFDDYKREKGS
jgi:ethanolamine utilization protein EutN